MAQGLRGWKSGGTAVLRGLLILLAIGALGAGGVTLAIQLIQGAQSGQPVPIMLTGVAAFLGCLVAAAVFLWMASVLGLLMVQIRQAQLEQTTFDQMRTSILMLEQTLRTQEENRITRPATPLAAPAAAQSPPPLPMTATPAASPMANRGHAPEEPAGSTVDLLRQLRDLLMMSDVQRMEFARSHWEKRRDAIVKAIEREIDTNQWEAATGHVRELQALLPEDPATGAMARKVETEKATRLRQDLEAARIQLRHLMSITAWPQVEEIVAGLARKYPSTPEIQAVADDVAREKAAFEADNLNALITDLKDATDHRQWRRALTIADELLRRYPTDKRVEKLKREYPTIQENAETQERKEEEALFKDLLHRQRYEDALAVATRVMEKYPASPLTAELNKILPKVRELIQQERAKRAQAEKVE